MTTTLRDARQAFSGSDVVVLFCDPERADYDNRRGAVYGVCAYVQVEAADGSRWTLHHTWTGHAYEVEARAAAFARRVQARLDAGGHLRPHLWAEARPGYGSEAYVAGGWQHEDLLEERQWDEEAEFARLFGH